LRPASAGRCTRVRARPGYNGSAPRPAALGTRKSSFDRSRMTSTSESRSVTGPRRTRRDPGPAADPESGYIRIFRPGYSMHKVPIEILYATPPTPHPLRGIGAGSLILQPRPHGSPTKRTLRGCTCKCTSGRASRSRCAHPWMLATGASLDDAGENAGAGAHIRGMLQGGRKKSARLRCHVHSRARCRTQARKRQRRPRRWV